MVRRDRLHPLREGVPGVRAGREAPAPRIQHAHRRRVASDARRRRARHRHGGPLQRDARHAGEPSVRPRVRGPLQRVADALRRAGLRVGSARRRGGRGAARRSGRPRRASRCDPGAAHQDPGTAWSDPVRSLPAGHHRRLRAEGRAPRQPVGQRDRGSDPQHLPGGQLEVVEQVARLPKDVDRASLSRLPLLERAELDAEGQKHYDAVVSSGSRTLVGLRGPSGIWLHSPKLAGYLRAANQYLRFETALDRRLTELAILVTARELDNQFEWTAHEPAALAEGLEAEIIDIVKRRKPLARLGKRLGKKEAVIIAFGRELFGKRQLSAPTYSRASELFGRRGVLELAALMGNYAMTAVILDAVDQQLHPDQKPLLPVRRAH